MIQFDTGNGVAEGGHPMKFIKKFPGRVARFATPRTGTRKRMQHPGPGIETGSWTPFPDADDENGGGTRAVAVDAGGQDGEGQSPGALWAQGLEEGEGRLSRRPLSAAATGLVGGFDVMIGVAVAAVLAGSLSQVMPPKLAAVLGSLVFGVGFVLITIGRSELFSENFLIPVGAVLEGRKPLRRLPTLWAPTLVTNIVLVLK